MLVQPLPQCHGTMSINDHCLVNAHVRVIFHCVGLTAFHDECIAWFIALGIYIWDVVMYSDVVTQRVITLLKCEILQA